MAVLLYIVVRDLIRLTIWLIMAMVDLVIWIIELVNAAAEDALERKEAKDDADKANEESSQEDDEKQAGYSNRR